MPDLELTTRNAYRSPMRGTGLGAGNRTYLIGALLVGVLGMGCGQSSGGVRTDGGCLGDVACGTGGAGGGGTGIGGAAGGVPPGGNQIVNGDFSDGQTDWGVASGSTFVTSSVANGQLCVSFPAGVLVTISWPGGLSPVASVVPGVTYLLSYQMSSNVPLSTFDVRVGPAESLYNGTATDFDVTSDVPGTTLQTFSHSFSVTAADDQAGVAFKALYGIYSGLAMICLDNVSLTTSS
jgi:hypothetical protein